MAKPTNFFVGITDLFSIIQPGAAMAYVCRWVETYAHADVLGLRTLDPNQGYVAFFAVDGALNLRFHALPHAQLAFMVAMVFFVAGLFHRQQRQ